MDTKKYTQEQIEIQAICFQMLNRRIRDYFNLQAKMPDFIKDENPDTMIGFMARMIWEENMIDAFGDED